VLYPALKAFSDLVAVSLAVFLAWFLRYEVEIGGPVPGESYIPYTKYLPVQIALPLVLLPLFHAAHLYSLSRATSSLRNLLTLAGATGFGLMFVLVANALTQNEIFTVFSRLFLLYAWVGSVVLVLLGRALVQAFMSWLHSHDIAIERVLLVGDSLPLRMVMHALAGQAHRGYRVVGFLSADGQSNTSFGRFQALGSIYDLEETIRRYDVDEVIISLSSEDRDAVLRPLEHCRRDGVRFRLVPDLFDITLSRVDMEDLNGIPLIGLKEVSISGADWLLKRGIDVIISAIGLLVTAPLCLLIALLIKLDSPGPVLYKQVRVGKGGNHFIMYKFRSMKEGAEDEQELLEPLNEAQGPLFKIADDPRRTRVGRFLRRTSLDELPQLWNVLKGEMSLVGPRPPVPREVEQYEDWHKWRLQVSPGITGLWQVSGRSLLSFDEMVMLDIYYIQYWSLGQDLRILLRTIPAVLSGGGAY